MKPFDLRSYEKVSEDKSTVTMRHPKGHEITIVLKALPKIQREQLKRLKMKEENRAHYDEGSDQPVSEQDLPQQDNGQQQDTQDAAQPQMAQPQTHTTNVIVNTPQPQQPPAALGVMAPNNQVQAPTPYQPNVPAPNAQLPNTSPGGEFLPGNAATNIQHETQRQGQIASEAENVKGNAAAQQAEIERQAANQQLANLADMKKHTQDFDTFLQSKELEISPRHFAESLSTPRKVATAIGLFLGGFKQGFSGGSNPAMDFLNQQIDRDIASQKQRQDNVKTIYGAYKHLYDNETVATNLTKITMNNMIARQAEQSAAKLGSANAISAANVLAANMAADNNKRFLESAGLLSSTPNAGAGRGGGAVQPLSSNASPNSNPRLGPPSQANEIGGLGGMLTPSAKADETQKKEQTLPDRILTPNAEALYNASLSKFNHTMSDDEKKHIQDEYLKAHQVDESLGAIDELYQQAVGKATYGGYLANKVDPKLLGAAGAAAAEGLGAIGAIPTAGASLVGAIPGAIAAGAGGAAIGSGIKTGLRAIGGQSESQYETAIEAIKTAAARALGAGAGLTPSAVGDIVDQFLPTKMDSEATWKDKLTKLKQKIIAAVQTGTLDAHKATYRSTRKNR